MSRFGIENARGHRLFEKGDLIVYALLIILIAGLFLGILLPNQKNALQKVEIYIGETKFLTYDFLSKKSVYSEIEGVRKEEYTQNGILYLKITQNSGYNVLAIGDDYVKMEEADCSSHADCVHNFSPITSEGDVIICLPHRLKAVGVGDKADNKVTL